jgi:CHAD domain-containing protein
MGAHPRKSPIEVVAPAKLSKLARKRLERFATLFPKALVSDAPETVHDLRVASRRLQQVLRILLPNSASRSARKLARMPRKVRRAFGVCRNLDVSLALVEKQLNAPSSASMRRSWDAVKAWLEEKRGTEMAQARKQLARRDLIGFIVRLQTRLAERHQEPTSDEELKERLRAAFAAWNDSLTSAQADPDVKALHGLRIAGKRLRYRAESAAALGDSSVHRMIQDLKTLQDELGDWHDRFVLRQYVAEFIGRAGFPAEEPGMCRALLLEMEREKERDQAAVGEMIAKAAEFAARESQTTSGEPLTQQAAKSQ